MEIDNLKLKKVKKKFEYQAWVMENNKKIRKEVKKENKKFRKEHKKIFLMLDLAIILLIVMNLGAILITNALVFKVGDNEALPIITEANPVVAKIDGFQASPGGFKIINQFLRIVIAWTLLLAVYLYRRNTIYQIWQLNILIFFVLFLLTSLGMDFINDLGFFIGKGTFT